MNCVKRNHSWHDIVKNDENMTPIGRHCFDCMATEMCLCNKGKDGLRTDIICPIHDEIMGAV